MDTAETASRAANAPETSLFDWTAANAQRAPDDVFIDSIDQNKAITHGQFFSLTKGTVSQTVSALHRKGMIDKVSDEADGRLIHLHLTRAGERVVKEAFPPVLLQAATTDEDEELLVLLDELLLRMQRATGSVSFGECQTCAHFRREGDRRFRCGLFSEPLRRGDIVKICLEHVRPDD